MIDSTVHESRLATGAANGAATVTALATRRRSDDILTSISFVFGGVHYGTFSIAAPYTRGKPIVLYIVPEHAEHAGEVFAGPLECLITDDVAPAADLDVAR